MLVIADTSIFGQIRNAIMSNEAAGTSIKRIELTQVEMYELVNNKLAVQRTDENYSTWQNDWAIYNLGPAKKFNVAGKGEQELPTSLWIRNVQVVTIDSP